MARKPKHRPEAVAANSSTTVPTSPRALPILHAPGIDVHRPSVAEWCGCGPLGGPDLEPLAAEVSPQFFDSVSALRAAVLASEPDDPVVVVRRRADREFDDLLESRRIVWLELDAAVERRDDARLLIRGRGVNGYHWAVRSAHYHWHVPPSTIAYGADRDQVGELRVPVGDGPFPVVVLLHGGYWREQWERDTIEPLAVALATQGYATWNVEYRRTGPGGGGGWPETFDDVARAIDFLADLAAEHPLDLDHVVVAGHSAGGHLALWVGARTSFADGPGAAPRVHPHLVVSLAGVVDLAGTADRCAGFGANPVVELMGGMPVDIPQIYERACPQQLPLTVPAILVQGTAGDDPDLIDLCRSYVDDRHGEQISYIERDDADHFALVEPHHAAWLAVAARIAESAPPAQSGARESVESS